VPETVAVCIFAKPPRPGEAKTRLAPVLGAAGAARLARAFLLDAVDRVRALPWALPYLATTGSLDRDLRERLGDLPVWPQGDGDLGARQLRILRRGLEHAPAALVVGTDLPGLPAAHFERARALLDTHDAVLGPAEDGGFYLLGLRLAPKGLLDDLPWSRADTCEQTRGRLLAHGMRVGTAPVWFDVDVPEDLERLHESLVDPGVVAPATRRALAALLAG